MRLIKYLATSGIASRRQCESIIRSNRVTVNGHSVTNPFYVIKPRDAVQVDGDVITPPEETVVFILNKPKNVITTVKDTHGRPTVMDIVGRVAWRIYPVGRLDKDSTGVLLLTNDGDLAYRLTHPRFRVTRIYRVTVDKPLSKSDIEKIESGIEIGQGEVGRAEVLSHEVSGERNRSPRNVVEVRVSLKHGKKREIRRLFSVLGYRVLALHREAFAGVTENGLQTGEWRQMTTKEIEQLRSCL